MTPSIVPIQVDLSTLPLTLAPDNVEARDRNHVPSLMVLLQGLRGILLPLRRILLLLRGILLRLLMSPAAVLRAGDGDPGGRTTAVLVHPEEMVLVVAVPAAAVAVRVAGAVQGIANQLRMPRGAYSLAIPVL